MDDRRKGDRREDPKWFVLADGQEQKDEWATRLGVTLIWIPTMRDRRTGDIFLGVQHCSEDSAESVWENIIMAEETDRNTMKHYDVIKVTQFSAESYSEDT